MDFELPERDFGCLLKAFEDHDRLQVTCIGQVAQGGNDTTRNHYCALRRRPRQQIDTQPFALFLAVLG